MVFRVRGLVDGVVSRVKELYPAPGTHAALGHLEALHAGVHHLVSVRGVQQPVRAVVRRPERDQGLLAYRGGPDVDLVGGGHLVHAEHVRGGGMEMLQAAVWRCYRRWYGGVTGGGMEVLQAVV